MTKTRDSLAVMPRLGLLSVLHPAGGDARAACAAVHPRASSVLIGTTSGRLLEVGAGGGGGGVARAVACAGPLSAGGIARLGIAVTDAGAAYVVVVHADRCARARVVRARACAFRARGEVAWTNLAIVEAQDGGGVGLGARAVPVRGAAARPRPQPSHHGHCVLPCACAGRRVRGTTTSLSE